MKKNLRYLTWLLVWLGAFLPLAVMAASVTAVAAVAPLPPVRDFLFTEPEFETLRDAKAIDDRPITALAQDARGLIWIGTQTGLVSYDGYRFRRFVHKAGDPFSLAGHYVRSLAVAQDGRIWVGTVSDGISVFDPVSERFEHFRHDEKVPDSLGGGAISALVDDGHGGMWVATDQGLDHLLAGGKGFVHFRHGSDPRSLLNDKVRSLLLDKVGRLWVGSQDGLQRLSPDGKSFETVVRGKSVVTLFQSEDGKLWLGTREHGAAWLMPNNAASQVNWLAQVKADQIWLASFGGGIIVVAADDCERLPRSALFWLLSAVL